MEEQVKLIERVKRELGMSQSDIAKMFNMGTTTISDWVNKKRKITTSAKLALEYMLKDKENQKELEIINSFISLLNSKRKNIEKNI